MYYKETAVRQKAIIPFVIYVISLSFERNKKLCYDDDEFC